MLYGIEQLLYGIEQLLCCLLPHSCLLCHNKKRHIKQAAQKLRRLDRAQPSAGGRQWHVCRERRRLFYAQRARKRALPQGAGRRKYREGCYPCRRGFARLLCIVGSHCGSNKIHRGFICVGRLSDQTGPFSCTAPCAHPSPCSRCHRWPYAGPPHLKALPK